MKKPVIVFGNSNSLSPTVMRRNVKQALTMAVLGVVGGGLVSMALLWRNLPAYPVPQGALSVHMKTWLKVGVNKAVPIVFTQEAKQWVGFKQRLADEGKSHLYFGRIAISISFGSLLGVFFFYLGLKPTNGYTHNRGRQLIEGEKSAQQLNFELASKVKALGADHRIHPEVIYTHDDFTKHILYIGAIGGGKTTAILYLLKQIFAKGERALIFDVKGDMTQKFPKALLIAPWDKRSAIWFIGADITSRQDAREFAAQVIQESKDPMWAMSARQLFTGIILMLQSKKPGEWGWLDLSEALNAPDDDIANWMLLFNKEAHSIVSSQNQTTSGILITMRSGLAWINDLAQAWGNPTKKNGFSFNKWLLNEKSKVRQIILQGNGRFETMQQGYAGAIISMLMARINSPQYSDSRTRKLWFVLDEFAQLGKVKYQPGVEAGRSKGICMVFGFQDISQIKKLYSAEDAAALMSMVGTKVLAQISPGETAKQISELVGQKEVERYNLSTSSQAGGASTTAMLNREEHKVIFESELASKLGVIASKKIVRCLFLTNNSNNSYIIDYPWDTTPVSRPAYVEAEWVSAPPIKYMDISEIAEALAPDQNQEQDDEKNFFEDEPDHTANQNPITTDEKLLIEKRNARVLNSVEKLFDKDKKPTAQETQIYNDDLNDIHAQGVIANKVGNIASSTLTDTLLGGDIGTLVSIGTQVLMQDSTKVSTKQLDGKTAIPMDDKIKAGAQRDRGENETHKKSPRRQL